MEDAAIHEVKLADGNAVFGVFDGHGGIITDMQADKSVRLWDKSLSRS